MAFYVLGIPLILGTGRADAHATKFLRYDGKHIRLQTDVGTSQDAKDYVAAFDAATDQWTQFWNLPPKVVQSWSVDAVIMSDRNVATAAGLMGDRIPDFKFGFAAGNMLYVIAQPSQYYTQHLLLHEGVHSLALHAFGGMGPAWFMEGTAELLATHRGSGPDIVVNRIPHNREQSPYWGRLKVIRDAHASGTIMSLEAIMRQPARLDGDVTSYSWSWAAAMLLTEYPEYNDAFKIMTVAGHNASPELTRQLYSRLNSQWPAVVARFRLMSLALDYGFEWSRERVAISTSDSMFAGDPVVVTIDANQGWQSVGMIFPQRTAINIAAYGEVILAYEPKPELKPWTSQPPGVTIRYHNARPLGQLIGCLVPTNFTSGQTLPALQTFSIAENTTIHIEQPSWLVFRINDAVGELGDNNGSYHLRLSIP